MTIEQLERKIESIDRHAMLVRSSKQSLAFARSVDRALSAIDNVGATASREVRNELYTTVIRAMDVQVKMWKGRLEGQEN